MNLSRIVLKYNNIVQRMRNISFPLYTNYFAPELQLVGPHIRLGNISETEEDSYSAIDAAILRMGVPKSKVISECLNILTPILMSVLQVIIGISVAKAHEAFAAPSR